MLAAIGSSTFASPDCAGTSGILQAQLDRYQKELSDCVDCDSANTRQGRETIQALSNKISAIKARLEEITITKSNTQPATPNARMPAGIEANKDALASGTQCNTVVATASVSGSANSTVGSKLDVLA
jgi:hypothetical protein